MYMCMCMSHMYRQPAHRCHPTPLTATAYIQPGGHRARDAPGFIHSFSCPQFAVDALLLLSQSTPPRIPPVGIYTHDVHRRWGSVFWRSWARVIRGRLPVIDWAAECRHPSPRPATRVRARPRGCWRGRGVAAGAPRRRARGTRGGRPLSGSRRAGWRVGTGRPAEPTMLRLNSHFLGF